jgi:hypothetical protein
VVDHLTRVTVQGDSARARALGAALADLGFAVRAGARGLVAESAVVEGQHVKTYLRGRGFADREFQVYVEYARRWGTL